MSAFAILVFDFSQPQHHLVRVDPVRTACEQTLSKADQNGTFSGSCEQLDQAEKSCIAGSSSFCTRYCCAMTSVTRIAYGLLVRREIAAVLAEPSQKKLVHGREPRRAP
jgi:hypothetical protein